MNKGDVLSLKCTADGYPAPNITWTRLSDNSIVTMPLNISAEQDEGGYRCTADNGFGGPARRDVFITLPSKFMFFLCSFLYIYLFIEQF